MRRLGVALAASAATVISLAMAAPAQAAAQSTTQTGPYATAFFSDAPADPQPGDTYQEVIVDGNDIVSTGAEPSMPSASIDIKRYNIGSEGFPELTSETLSGATGSDVVSFTADKFLTSASLTATLDASKTCYPYAGAEGGFCEQTAGGTISMTWTGTGILIRSLDNTRTVAPGVGVFIAHHVEITRAATASGTALGLTLSESQDAVIGMQDYRDTLNVH